MTLAKMENVNIDNCDELKSLYNNLGFTSI